MVEITVAKPCVDNFCIEDGLTELEVSLEKAEFILQEIAEDYFRFIDPIGHGTELVWDYRRASAKAYIVGDYLFEMHKKLAQFEEYMEQAKEPQKASATV
jgi:hypothetical protein